MDNKYYFVTFRHFKKQQHCITIFLLCLFFCLNWTQGTIKRERLVLKDHCFSFFLCSDAENCNILVVHLLNIRTAHIRSTACLLYIDLIYCRTTGYPWYFFSCNIYSNLWLVCSEAFFSNSEGLLNMTITVFLNINHCITSSPIFFWWTGVFRKLFQTHLICNILH